MRKLQTSDIVVHKEKCKIHADFSAQQIEEIGWEFSVLELQLSNRVESDIFSLF